jgi:hypothetical protein
MERKNRKDFTRRPWPKGGFFLAMWVSDSSLGDFLFLCRLPPPLPPAGNAGRDTRPIGDDDDGELAEKCERLLSSRVLVWLP